MYRYQVDISEDIFLTRSVGGVALRGRGIQHTFQRKLALKKLLIKSYIYLTHSFKLFSSLKADIAQWTIAFKVSASVHGQVLQVEELYRSNSSARK